MAHRKIGDEFILDFEGEHYAMSIDKAKEMLAYLEGMLERLGPKGDLPEFIEAVRAALAEQHDDPDARRRSFEEARKKP